MLMAIVRTASLCALLAVIAAASFDFSLRGGIDPLVSTMIALLAVLAVVSTGASLTRR